MRPLCMGNGILCFRERHQLLLECLINFLMCTRMIGRASYSIYNPVIANIVSLLPNTNLKFRVKYQPLVRHPPLTGNGMRCCDLRHVLPIDCYMTFPRCTRMSRGKLLQYLQAPCGTPCHYYQKQV